MKEEKIAFQIQLSDTVADAKEISLLVGHAFRSFEPFKSMFKDCREAEYFAWTYNIVFEMLNRSGCQTWKVVEAGSSKIVSYLTVQHPHVMSKKEKEKEKTHPLSQWMPAGLPAGANVKLMEETFTIMGRIRPNNGYNPEVDYMGSMIVTHPSYQGQGHAKRLIQMGLRFADEKRRKWYAACWPTSAKLYRQLGFWYLAEEEVDLSKYGGEGKAVLTLLVKEPARSVVEELRHQLLD